MRLPALCRWKQSNSQKGERRVSDLKLRTATGSTEPAINMRLPTEGNLDLERSLDIIVLPHVGRFPSFQARNTNWLAAKVVGFFWSTQHGNFLSSLASASKESKRFRFQLQMTLSRRVSTGGAAALLSTCCVIREQVLCASTLWRCPVVPPPLRIILIQFSLGPSSNASFLFLPAAAQLRLQEPQKEGNPHHSTQPGCKRHLRR